MARFKESLDNLTAIARVLPLVKRGSKASSTEVTPELVKAVISHIAAKMRSGDADALALMRAISDQAALNPRRTY